MRGPETLARHVDRPPYSVTAAPLRGLVYRLPVTDGEDVTPLLEDVISEPGSVQLHDIGHRRGEVGIASYRAGVTDSPTSRVAAALHFTSMAHNSSRCTGLHT